MKKLLLILLVAAAYIPGVHAQPSGQNNFCDVALPFCTGTLYNFPAGVNAGAGEQGPCYSCLVTRPNPAWYYMKVDSPGSIIISMHSQPSKDIDFCCWGPFSSQFCCDSLTCNKVVDCSYSPSSSEVCNINNGQTGQYYMLVITNYSNQPCNIIFNQTGGTGTTDCTILPPPCTSNSPICVTQTIQLSAQPVSGATYHWSGPNGFLSNLQNPSIPNAQLVNSGSYYLKISVNGQPSQDSTETIVNVYNPLANAGNDTTIANGVYATLHGNCTGGSGSYSYHWEPANLLINPDLRVAQTVNLFATTVFTVSATDDSAGCVASDIVTVNILGGPLAVNAIALPSSICFGSTTQLQAIGSGGAGNYTYNWTGPNGFTSTLASPTVQPTVTSTYNVTVFDGYNTSNGSVIVTVIPLPVANAGTDQSIPYGTYTFLHGSVLDSSSTFFYSWSPAAMLVNAGVRFPQTINMTATTIYSLVVTDLATNCISNNSANVTVEVTGGPLGANPVATPDWICKGDSTRLYAGAGGGNVGFYEYTWVSDPPGFTSTDPSPWVDPLVNTTYTVTVYDGFNSTSGNTQVSIYPQPVIYLGPADTLVCIYDTVTLDAGNPGAIYLWSNGATTRTIDVTSAGITFDVQTFSVEVTNANGCMSESTITISFAFAGCTGIEDQQGGGTVEVYPNPAGDRFNIRMHDVQEPFQLEIMDVYGRVVTRIFMPKPENDQVIRQVGTQGLPAGIYLLRFKGRTLNSTIKLVIQK
jgi:hypothetical protein